MSTDLDQRYGTTGPARGRVLAAVAGAVAAAFLGWVAWTALVHGDPAVTSTLLTYDIEDDHAAQARVRVDLGQDDVEATCLLRAYAADHTVVGELSYPVVAADLGADGVVERTVRTERRATSVQSVGCTAPGQPRPR